MVVVSTARVVGAAPASVPSVTVLDVVGAVGGRRLHHRVALSTVVVSAVAVVVVVSGGSWPVTPSAVAPAAPPTSSTPATTAATVKVPRRVFVIIPGSCPSRDGELRPCTPYRTPIMAKLRGTFHVTRGAPRATPGGSHPGRGTPGARPTLLDATGNTQSFAPDGTGAEVAFRSLSQSTAKMRSQVRERVVVDKEDFFRGEKDAEVDRTTRWV